MTLAKDSKAKFIQNYCSRFYSRGEKLGLIPSAARKSENLQEQGGRSVHGRLPTENIRAKRIQAGPTCFLLKAG